MCKNLTNFMALARSNCRFVELFTFKGLRTTLMRKFFSNKLVLTDGIRSLSRSIRLQQLEIFMDLKSILKNYSQSLRSLTDKPDIFLKSLDNC